MSKNLTVVLCIFGKANVEVLDAVLTSIRRQTVDVDIIISEQMLDNDLKITGKDLARKYSTKFVRSKADKCKEGYPFNIGRIRNIAAHMCETKYIYYSDADVLFYDTTYLERLLTMVEKHPDSFFCFPPMARVSRNTGKQLVDSILNKTFPVFENNEILKQSEQNCYVEFDEKNNKLMPALDRQTYRNESYINSSVDTSKKYMDVFNGKDPYKLGQYSQEDVHKGGVLIDIDKFWEIGGYGETFYKWGFEDSDLLWKLESVLNRVEMRSAFHEYPLIHVEHELNYDRQIFFFNSNINTKRRLRGVDKIIEMDRNRNNSFVKAVIMNDKEEMYKFIVETKNYKKRGV